MLCRADFLYADDGLVTSNDPDWLQVGFDSLTGLFNRVGIQTNVSKTVRILCHPCDAVVTHLEAYYKQRMTG